MAKEFTNIQDANKEIARLTKKLCCCPSNCPVSERTYYGDNGLTLLDIVIVNVFVNGTTLIFGSDGLTLEDTIIAANAALLGLATLSYENGVPKMVTNLCIPFGFIAGFGAGE